MLTDHYKPLTTVIWCAAAISKTVWLKHIRASSMHLNIRGYYTCYYNLCSHIFLCSNICIVCLFCAIVKINKKTLKSSRLLQGQKGCSTEKIQVIIRGFLFDCMQQTWGIILTLQGSFLVCLNKSFILPG